jgi:hypothetical protein
MNGYTPREKGNGFFVCNINGNSILLLIIKVLTISSPFVRTLLDDKFFEVYYGVM